MLALTPLFVAMLFFDSTKRFFEAWIAQLANYALVIILVATVANLLLNAILQPVNLALAAGAGVTLALAFRMCVFAAFVLLIMRQILPMAAGLASGIALTTGNVISRGIAAGLGTSRNVGRGMWDSLTNQGTTRWDPMTRKGGYYLGQGARATSRAAWRTVSGSGRNTVSDATPRTGAASQAPKVEPRTSPPLSGPRGPDAPKG